MRIDCKSVDQALDRHAGVSGASLPENVRRHLAECPNCRSLHALLDTDLTVPEVPAELRAAIGKSLAESLKPVKPLPGRWASTLQLIALFTILALVLVANMGTAGLEHMSRFELLAMSALLATGVCLFSASLASQIRPGSYQRLSGRLLVAAFGVGLLSGMALLFPWRDTTSFVAMGWPCLVGGLGIAAPGAVLMWLILRRGAPVAIGTLGASIGAAAGLLGVTVLQFRCPLQEAPHLMVWHGGVLVVATVGGSAVALLTHRRFSANEKSYL